MVENKYVNRVIVTDGNFLYNCATKRILKNNAVETDIFDVILFGVLYKEKKIILPEHLCGHKVQCISVQPYDKGEKFPNKIEKYSIFPTLINKSVHIYDIQNYYYADSNYYIKANNYYATEYVVPEGVSLIGRAFYRDTKIEKIHFKSSNSCIPYNCFSHCTSLKEIQLPSNLKSIHTNTFEKCSNLKSIALPNSLIIISAGAFQYSGLEYIIIPKNVRAINKETFMNCSNLHTVILGTNTERIYPNAFANCFELRAIFISPKVKSISKTAFANCSKLVIYSTKNSYAQNYAYKHGIPFIAIHKLPSLISN